MAVSRPTYCTREDVKAAANFRLTSEANRRVDRAIEAASDNIDGFLHRVFYPRDTTYRFDWPNSRAAPPWTLYFDQWDLIAATVVEVSNGTVNIPLGNVFLRPLNRKPGWPYTYMELDRSTVSAFSAGLTPQAAVQITGTWGFGDGSTDAAGVLAAAVSSTSAASITVSDGSLLGVGDLAIVDSERMLVTERATVTTGQTNVSGATTASNADVAVTVTDGTQVNLGEVLLLDSERLLITDITGNVLTVKRQYDGTVLAAHSGGTTLYAYRLLTVARGQLGTTAATHLNGAAVTRHRPPVKIRDLCIAEAQNTILQESGGYSRTTGEADMAHPAPGDGLADLWSEADSIYGRHARQRTV